MAFMSITDMTSESVMSGNEQGPKSVKHRILNELNMSAILFHRPGANLYYALYYFSMYSSFPYLSPWPRRKVHENTAARLLARNWVGGEASI